MDDVPNYSMEARHRLALSAAAAELSGVAQSLVSTYGEQGCCPGDLAGVAGYLLTTATDILTLAVACERTRSVGWQQIADAVDPNGDAEDVRRRYGEAVDGLQRRMVHAWIDSSRMAELPEGANQPGEVGAYLDEWLARKIRHDERGSRHPDRHVREHPVTAELALMSPTEYRNLIAVATRLIDESDLGLRAEIGLRRRQIELLEWLLAEEVGATEDIDDTAAELLRTRLHQARQDLDDIRSAPTERDR